MPYCEWDDESWQSIIHTIRNGNCILMLGPGTSLESYHGKDLPCDEIFAHELFARIEDKFNEWRITPDIGNVAQIAQYYAMHKDRNLLEASTTDFYLKRQHDTTELHRNLAVLPFSVVVSSTLDCMFCNAVKAQENKTPVTARYHFCGDNAELVPQGTVEKPLIFNLYGSIEEPDSLVLTEDDFLELLTSKHPLPDNITSLLTAKNKSLLFLGFGFNRWYIRVLLHLLKISPKANRSFALEQQLPPNNPEFDRTLLFFRESDYQIQFFEDDMQSFVKTLKDKYQQYSGSGVAKPAQTFADDAPTAFICHANENKAQAMALHRRLAQQGIRTWIDKENLRGGEQWNRHIERAIKTVDYVLVLQSQALENKLEGYVNKEIKLALDRQLSFRSSRFIIPLKIDVCEPLEELEFLQMIDLSPSDNVSDGFNGLVRVIKRDWQRRERGRA